MKNPQVLIVGAGPTGLASATFLAKLGVSIRVIDQNSARSDQSKALGVQAGTLECLKHALGPNLSELMVSSGRPAREAWIHFDDGKPIKVDLSTISSPHNYILILKQSETEMILEEFLAGLSIQVERKSELISMEERGDKVFARIRTSSGEIEEISSSFVIGCDGAHSKTRHLLGIPFQGAAYTGNFILGDVKLEWPWPYDSIQTFVSKRGVLASFPLKGEQLFRLIMIPKVKEAVADSAEIQVDEFQKILSNLSLGQFKVQTPLWLTRFRVHHRMVENFQRGRVFLAGDAAHIHSPAGGQGMNTGIQDVFNLSYKLKLVLSRKKPIEFLRLYEKERLPVARNVLRGTDFAFRMALMPDNRFITLIRRTLVPLVAQSAWVQKRVVSAMSEVEIAHREINRFQWKEVKV